MKSNEFLDRRVGLALAVAGTQAKVRKNRFSKVAHILPRAPEQYCTHVPSEWEPVACDHM